MQKIKWLIIVLVIFLIILLGVVVYLINIQQEGEQLNTIGEAGDVIDYENLQTEQVTNNIDFFTVSNCVNQYLDIINTESSIYYGYDENNNYGKIVSDNDIKNNIYSLLSESYINNNGIRIDNLYEYIKTNNEKIIFLPLKMNVLTRANAEVYAVYGIEYTLDNTYMGEKYYIVNLDRNNSTFSIEPIEDGTYSDINQIVLENNDDINIELSDYNEYIEEMVNYEILCQNTLMPLKH